MISNPSYLFSLLTLFVSVNLGSPLKFMTELSLPHYILFRKDRSRHGGGIAIYISASLNSSVPFSVPSHSLEFLSLSFTFLKRSFHIGCFYRPPTSSSDLLSLTNLLLSAGFIYISPYIGRRFQRKSSRQSLTSFQTTHFSLISPLFTPSCLSSNSLFPPRNSFYH